MSSTNRRGLLYLVIAFVVWLGLYLLVGPITYRLLYSAGISDAASQVIAVFSPLAVILFVGGIALVEIASKKGR